MANHQHVAVVDLSFGDAGKGAEVDNLASTSDYDVVVRFSGGAQAAHHVTHPETGKVHRFSQFGSGTFRGLDTHLSQFMMVDPLRLANEAKQLHHQHGIEFPLDMISVHPWALVTTPYHAYANRAKEVARGADAHGSCGVGVGETMQFSLTTGKLGFPKGAEDPTDTHALRMRDFCDMDVVREKLKFLRACYSVHDGFGSFADEVPSVDDLVEAYRWVADDVIITGNSRIYRDNRCIFEGSQGVLLDEWYGFHPHTTWSTTTFANVNYLLSGSDTTAYRLGVLRSYTTRHGAGPFPTESPKMLEKWPELHNGTGTYQGAWRAGHFDAVLHKYAVDVCGGVDGLAVNHLDYPVDRFCVGYELDGLHVDRLTVNQTPEDLSVQERLGQRLREVEPLYFHPWASTPVETIEDLMDIPVVIQGRGPAASDRSGTIPS